MVKKDYVSGRFYIEDCERITKLPLWISRLLNGAEYYLVSNCKNTKRAGGLMLTNVRKVKEGE